MNEQGGRPASTTTRAVRVARHGGPEVLVLETVDLAAPGPGQVLVDVAAAGVNFIDTYQRSGLYPVPLPFTVGREGAGTVRAVGDGVDDVAPGARVAWLDQPGSYADHALLAADRLVAVPAGMDLDVAAAAMLQGATAHYLVTDTFPLGPGHTALVHAAAGGVGQLLVQMAKGVGARVVATVGSADKADIARGLGADHVIDYRTGDFAEEVEALLGPHAVDVVYDGVGRTTFAGGLRVLRPRGLMVTFGNASGPVDPFSPLELSRGGSLFLTRPTLDHYVASTEELRRRCGAVLGAIAGGDLTLQVGERVPLAEAGRAHELLESRASRGKVLLLPG